MPLDDSRPIWVQLVDDFTARIVSGEWAPGSKVPSVRDLALTRGVNPNTVQRALTRIDEAGLTLTERASGRFVTTDEHRLREARLAHAADATRTWIRTLRGLGMGPDDAHILITLHWDEAPEVSPAQDGRKEEQ